MVVERLIPLREMWLLQPPLIPLLKRQKTKAREKVPVYSQAMRLISCRWAGKPGEEREETTSQMQTSVWNSEGFSCDTQIKQYFVNNILKICSDQYEFLAAVCKGHSIKYKDMYKMYIYLWLSELRWLVQGDQNASTWRVFKNTLALLSVLCALLCVCVSVCVCVCVPVSDKVNVLALGLASFLSKEWSSF